MTELTLLESYAAEECFLGGVDPRAKLVVTLVYIVAVLSFSLNSLTAILLFAVYPIIAASLSAVPYGKILLKSLYVLPFVAAIGVFNPIYHRQTAFFVGSVAVSVGWVEFASLTIRGLLSVQAVLLLIYSTGYYNVCRALGRLGVPAMFAGQLMFVYRYIFVLVQEAVSMDRARKSRSFGRRSYSLGQYATFVGQLLIRTVMRARRIYDAMVSRGYDGHLRPGYGCRDLRWRWADTAYVALWIALFAAGRFLDVDKLFNF